MSKYIRVMPHKKIYMNSLDAVEREVISLWEDLAEERGFNRVLGKVIFTLLIEERPLSQGELAEKTGYSIPTISRVLNTLVSLGSARKASMPGSRLTLYYMEMRPQDMLIGGLRKWVSAAQNMQRRLSNVRRTLRQVKEQNPERARRIDNLLARFYDSIPKMIDMIEKAVEEMREIS